MTIHYNTIIIGTGHMTSPLASLPMGEEDAPREQS